MKLAFFIEPPRKDRTKGVYVKYLRQENGELWRAVNKTMGSLNVTMQRLENEDTNYKRIS